MSFKRPAIKSGNLSGDFPYKKQGCGLTHDYITHLYPAIVNDTDYVSSGTDNGILSLANTASFGLQRFKLHLELSNRYKPLESLKDNIGTDNIMENYKDCNYLSLEKFKSAVVL